MNGKWVEKLQLREMVEMMEKHKAEPAADDVNRRPQFINLLPASRPLHLCSLLPLYLARHVCLQVF